MIWRLSATLCTLMLLAVGTAADIAFAHQLGRGPSLSDFQFLGVACNSRQATFCAIAIILAVWRIGALMHVRAAIAGQRWLAATVTSVLLACATAISVLAQINVTQVAFANVQHGAALASIAVFAAQFSAIYLQLIWAPYVSLATPDLRSESSATQLGVASMPSAEFSGNDNLPIVMPLRREAVFSKRTAIASATARVYTGDTHQPTTAIEHNGCKATPASAFEERTPVSADSLRSSDCSTDENGGASARAADQCFAIGAATSASGTIAPDFSRLNETHHGCWYQPRGPPLLETSI